MTKSLSRTTNAKLAQPGRHHSGSQEVPSSIPTGGNCFYCPQTKFVKVMFLHLSVSHSVHKGASSCQGEGVSLLGESPCQGVSLPGGGSPGPHLGGLQAHIQGVSRPTLGGVIPGCTEADTPQQMATAAGGTHPTGMHSCLLNLFCSSPHKPVLRTLPTLYN